MADIRPHKAKEYTFRQSAHAHVPELPVRAVLLAPSGGGKTTMLVSLIKDIYPKCWERIYVWSPTVHLDDHWNAVKKYARDVLGTPEDEKCFFDTFEEKALAAVIEKHRRITHLAKHQGRTRLFGPLIILDHVADDPRITRRATSVHELFVRGRHYGLSVIASVQKYRVLAPIIRVNATDTFVFRLRSQNDAYALVEENSAAYGKDATAAILAHATAEPYSFLWINGRAKQQAEIFWLRFQSMLVPSSSKGSNSAPEVEDEEALTKARVAASSAKQRAGGRP